MLGKKTILLLGFVTTALNNVASQKIWIRGRQGEALSGDKALEDTLYNGFESYTPTLFESPTGGFMNGTNGYGDQAKAQMFFADSSYKVLGAMYWFGYKKQTQAPGTSRVVLRMYRRDAIQQVNGVLAPVPGTWHEQKMLLLEDVPSGNDLAQSALVWLLDTARFVSGAYFFGFDMELMHPLDTIALFSSDSGQVLRSNMSWEKWQGLWNTIENNWGLPVDFAVFPIVDLENAGVGAGFADIKFRMAGNPAGPGSLLMVESPSPMLIRLQLLTMDGRPVDEETFCIPAGGASYAPSVFRSGRKGLFLLTLQDDKKRGIAFRVLLP